MSEPILNSGSSTPLLFLLLFWGYTLSGAATVFMFTLRRCIDTYVRGENFYTIVLEGLEMAFLCSLVVVTCGFALSYSSFRRQLRWAIYK